DRQTLGEAKSDRGARGGPPGGVPVVAEDDPFAEPPQLFRLLRRQGRSHRGDGFLDAGAHEREVVEIALDEYRTLLPPDRVARLGEAVEGPLLLEERRLGRVEVLGLLSFGEGAAAEADGPAAIVAQHEEETVAEAVVGALGLGTRLQEP